MDFLNQAIPRVSSSLQRDDPTVLKSKVSKLEQQVLILKADLNLTIKEKTQQSALISEIDRKRQIAVSQLHLVETSMQKASQAQSRVDSLQKTIEEKNCELQREKISNEEEKKKIKCLEEELKKHGEERIELEQQLDASKNETIKLSKKCVDLDTKIAEWGATTKADAEKVKINYKVLENHCRNLEQKLLLSEQQKTKVMTFIETNIETMETQRKYSIQVVTTLQDKISCDAKLISSLESNLKKAVEETETIGQQLKEEKRIDRKFEIM